MKKIIIFLSLVIAIGLVQCSSDKYTRDAQELPAPARKMISEHFNTAISHFKIDKEFASGTEYEVVLDDGTEIDIDGKGNWKSIETANSKAIPASILPKMIHEYVAQHHQGASVVGIEKKKNGYEVELSNGLEINFNKDGGFVKYDK